MDGACVLYWGEEKCITEVWRIRRRRKWEGDILMDLKQ